MESNHNPRLRRPVYYPLYYAGKIGTRSRNRTYTSRVKVCCATTTLSGNKIGLHGRIRTYSLLTPDQAVYQIDITQR